MIPGLRVRRRGKDQFTISWRALELNSSVIIWEIQKEVKTDDGEVDEEKFGSTELELFLGRIFHTWSVRQILELVSTAKQPCKTSIVGICFYICMQLMDANWQD